MELLEQNKYLDISYDFENDLMLFIWKGSSKELNEGEFRRVVLLKKNAIQKYQPKFILINSLQFYFTISVETQDWINTEIIISRKEGLLIKVAIVMPEEWIAQLSIQQTMDDRKSNSNANIQTSYFASEKEARQWMLPCGKVG